MAFSKKRWKDRITEFPTRRTLLKADGTSETVTVTRSEGTISQEGDIFSASNMNDLESRIEAGFDVTTDKLESGSYSGKDGKTYTCTMFDKIGYDAINKKLLLQVEGENQVIPFSGGGADNSENIYSTNIIQGHHTSTSGSKTFNTKDHNAVIVIINVELEDKSITSGNVSFVNSTVALSTRNGNGYVYVLACNSDTNITMNYNFAFSSNDSENLNMVVIGM